MTEATRDRIIQALDAVDRPGLGGAETVWDLADLVLLTTILEQLSERAEHRLAARPTVTAHLGQARQQVVQLRRSLTCATETLAFKHRTELTPAGRVLTPRHHHVRQHWSEDRT